jgi:hypothetical protein
MLLGLNGSVIVASVFIVLVLNFSDSVLQVFAEVVDREVCSQAAQISVVSEGLILSLDSLLLVKARLRVQGMAKVEVGLMLHGL